MSLAGPVVHGAYKDMLKVMIDIFRSNSGARTEKTTPKTGLVLATPCVGAMVLVCAIDDSDLANERCSAAKDLAFNRIRTPVEAGAD